MIFQKIKIVIMVVVVLATNGIKAQAIPAGDDMPKAHKETKLTEIIPTDSVSSAELLKRAVNWVKIESAKYGKTNGISSGSKAECSVTFPVRPKELNPVCDYTGKVTMKVIIECKDSKYKYTIEHIKHVSNNGKTTMGSVDNVIPDCGSMIMPDLTFKKLKGEALKDAGAVINDIKESMKQSSALSSKEEW
ncbi:MAG: hypothetical protein JWO32_3092 [Bacteroidetes bacterium]|nr:hypothetical protein [Bacteroidota bacterium]